MGFDLKPRNKNLDWFQFGAFLWHWMLDSGVGLIINTAPAMKPGTFSYTPDKKGTCPNYSDGFHVTAIEARAMAMAARGLVKTKQWINSEWDKLTPKEKEKYETFEFYKKPVREDFIKKVEQFADWAGKSRGFWVW
jgi:hypothetical protein